MRPKFFYGMLGTLSLCGLIELYNGGAATGVADPYVAIRLLVYIIGALIIGAASEYRSHDR